MKYLSTTDSYQYDDTVRVTVGSESSRFLRNRVSIP